MPKYKYVAKTKDAKTLREVINVSSKEELVAKLRTEGLFVVSIQEIKKKVEGSSFFSALFSARRKRASIKLQDLTFFARNLSTTLSAGVTLLRSLEILVLQAESLKLEKILKNCHTSIKEGLSLSEAISRYPKVFSALWRGAYRGW
ncbi:MAG: type II secretion system F family protein [Candidatus Omnitrophota bacterium]